MSIERVLMVRRATPGAASTLLFDDPLGVHRGDVSAADVAVDDLGSHEDRKPGERLDGQLVVLDAAFDTTDWKII